jgi:hypothetical protein
MREKSSGTGVVATELSVSSGRGLFLSPKGFHQLAQGWSDEIGPTLGSKVRTDTTLKALARLPDRRK